MKNLFLFAFISLIAPLSQANASAVKGCDIKAKVREVKVDSTSGKDEVTLEVKIMKSSSFGHSAGRSKCGTRGTRLSFTPDNDADVIAAKLKSGDVIQLSEMTVFSLMSSGASVNHTRSFVSVQTSSK